MEVIQSYFGEILALLTAVAWALAVILFKKSGETVHPIGLNLFKNLMAVVLLVPTMWFMGKTIFREVPLGDYGIVFISGILGIAIADTLFFVSLNALGAGLSAIVVCMYSPFIIALSIIWLGESLTIWQLVGAAMIVLAVLAASLERNGDGSNRRAILWGILWGVLSQAANAAGIVMVKPLLERSPLLWVTEWRLFAGAAGLMAVLAVHRNRGSIVRSVFSRRRWGYTLSGSFTGAYLAMMLWLGGMKLAQASVASALNQTSTIFIFVFAALFLREPVTMPRVTGIALGVCGALLVTFG